MKGETMTKGMFCPAVPEHVGGRFVTACYERVTDAATMCPKCGRPVWLMGGKDTDTDQERTEKMEPNFEGTKLFASAIDAVIAREAADSETATDTSRDAAQIGANMGRIVFSAELRYHDGKFTLRDFRFERVGEATR